MKIFRYLLSGFFFLAATGAGASVSQAEDWNRITQSPQESVDSEEITGDPHHGSSTWLMPVPTVQQSADTQLGTVSMGGIFVPAMTSAQQEPKYQVLSATGEIISEGSHGVTNYISPGDYVIKVGTGALDNRLEFDVHVVAGKVTYVPVEWSGIIVKVVNDRGASFRGNYEIVRMPERAYVGIGTGEALSDGGRLDTWILWPGLYMIISAGEGYSARKNFVTIRLKPGELTQMTLVLDEETGDILGGGEIEEQVQTTEDKWWDVHMLIGGSVKFNRSDNVVGKATGQLLDIDAFFETTATIQKKKNFFYGRFNAEIGGRLHLNDRPFITTVDELSLELIYAYRVIDWFGPYARFSFESNMAPVYQELDNQATVERYSSSGELLSTETDVMDVYLSPSFSPITLAGGLGARFDASAGYWLKFNARIGVGYRGVFVRDLFVASDLDQENNLIKLTQVETSQQFGLEGALVLDLTPIDWFTLKADFSLLEPFNNWASPVIDLRLAAAVRITSIASLSYTLRLKYDRPLLDKVQLDQYLQLRFSYKIL